MPDVVLPPAPLDEAVPPAPALEVESVVAPLVLAIEVESVVAPPAPALEVESVVACPAPVFVLESEMISVSVYKVSVSAPTSEGTKRTTLVVPNSAVVCPVEGGSTRFSSDM